MSNGYVFCTKCLDYRRWEDVSNQRFPDGFLRCPHELDSICISKSTPHITSDDEFDEISIDTLVGYINDWKKKEHAIPCECGSVHILDLTFRI